jgi:hypothetical protein
MHFRVGCLSDKLMKLSNKCHYLLSQFKKEIKVLLFFMIVSFDIKKYTELGKLCMVLENNKNYEKSYSRLYLKFVTKIMIVKILIHFLLPDIAYVTQVGHVQIYLNSTF